MKYSFPSGMESYYETLKLLRTQSFVSLWTTDKIPYRLFENLIKCNHSENEMNK
jgi:hypothetical protein